MRHRDETCNFLRELSEKHNISYATLYARYHYKNKRGEDLIKPPKKMGRAHPMNWCGKSYAEWHQWFADNGRVQTLSSFKSTKRRCENRGMTDFEAIIYYLAYNNLLEKYLKEMNQTKLKGELFPYKSSK